MQEGNEWRRLSFFLLIFTESLWYPPLLGPVTGDSREVLKRTAVSPNDHRSYSENCAPFSCSTCYPDRKTCQCWESLKIGSQLQLYTAALNQSNAVPTNQCSPHMLDCMPTHSSPVFNNGLLWAKNTVNRVFINA